LSDIIKKLLDTGLANDLITNEICPTPVFVIIFTILILSILLRRYYNLQKEKYEKTRKKVMVRVDECFKCGVTERKAKLVYTLDKPVLCEKCSKI